MTSLESSARDALHARVNDYISDATGLHKLHRDWLHQFLRDYKKEELRFGKEVRSFLEQLYLKGNELVTVLQASEGVPDGDERIRHIDHEEKIRKWFAAQLRVAERMFGVCPA
jgi:hypothetical protein